MMGPMPEMDSPQLLSLRLREETRQSHEQIESVLDLMQPELTLEQYARLLERWYGFEQVWQMAADRAIGYLLPTDFLTKRRRLPMLRADLLACERTAEQIDALQSFPANLIDWKDRSKALGTLYVIEGSTLGGQHVAKFIKQHLGLTPEHGVAYFSSYGPDVGVRWRETKAVLDTPPFPIDADAVVAGAIATFDYLSGWLAPPVNVAPVE